MSNCHLSGRDSFILSGKITQYCRAIGICRDSLSDLQMEDVIACVCKLEGVDFLKLTDTDLEKLILCEDGSWSNV